MTTVKTLAELVGIEPEKLLSQFKEAGMEKKDADQSVTDEEKQKLLSFLRGGAGEQQAKPKKITLGPRRKKVSNLKVTGTTGKSKTVAVAIKTKAVIEEIEEEKPIEEEVVVAEPPVKEVVEKAAKTVEPTIARVSEPDKEKRGKKFTKEEPEEKKPAKKTRGKHVQDKFSSKYQKQELYAPLVENADERAERGISGFSDRAVRRAPKELAKHSFSAPMEPVTLEVIIPVTLSVTELAQKLSVKSNAVIKVLMGLGVMATKNQEIDQDTAILVVEEMGHKYKLAKTVTDETLLEDEVELTGEEIPRAPIVTIMGHVDHGKTSLLDYIRRSQVAEGEAGGITQHIGAYHVKTNKGEITFLDTPGHAAFTAMRARGAQVTDIVILIVAADDGPKPQTLEAVQHAKAAGVPMIVAVNKIDKPDSDPEKVKNELSRHEVVAEDWGGDTMFINISAKSGQGVDELLDTILLQAEMLELKAVAEGPAKGVVIESRLEKGRGPIATILVQSGTLKKGDHVIAGMEYGRVRAMLDENSKPVENAGPSIPVEVLGLSGTPIAGDPVIIVKTEQKAREIALFRQHKEREAKLATQQAAKLEDLFKNIGADEQKNLNIVLKADVQGSLEAISDALTKLSRDEVKINIIGSGVGGINESDATLALASQGIIIGFNVRADASAKRVVEKEGIELRYYSVIYELIDEVKKALVGMLDPVYKEEIIGLAEVRDVFRSPKYGSIAGCMVIDGLIKRNSPIRVLRDNVVIYEGSLESLRRFKDDVQEVRSGTECGIGVKNYDDVKVGDQIEVFERVQVAVEV